MDCLEKVDSPLLRASSVVAESDDIILCWEKEFLAFFNRVIRFILCVCVVSDLLGCRVSLPMIAWSICMAFGRGSVKDLSSKEEDWAWFTCWMELAICRSVV